MVDIIAAAELYNTGPAAPACATMASVNRTSTQYIKSPAMNRIPIISALMRFADGLRFRQLFLLMATLFLIDLLVPDFIPMADELVLGLLTLLLAAWKRERRGQRALERRDEEPH